MKPHKHAELIKAWADGAEIQYLYDPNQGWQNCNQPTWYENFEYRIKPQPNPDVVYYGIFGNFGAYSIDGCFTKERAHSDQIKIIFDGETGKLKSAEVLR